MVGQPGQWSPTDADRRAGSVGQTRDFFISYTAADQAWAEWIAWQLEAEGYTTVLQAWDFTRATTS
jgi:hypothetical protein